MNHGHCRKPSGGRRGAVVEIVQELAAVVGPSRVNDGAPAAVAVMGGDKSHGFGGHFAVM